jgi:Mn2+/Fe2+ NRAMP family transporter
VEHVLLALASVFATYVLAGVLAHPDWGAAARGLVVPAMPGSRDAIYLAVATVGTTLAPWGLAFIQSYAADKRIPETELAYERVDVVSGALLTGIIGACIVTACAATLHAHGLDVRDAADAARGLQPVAGTFSSTLFGLGIVGAALLAAAVVPLSTAYSVCEAMGRPADIDDGLRAAPHFYGVFALVVALAGALVVVPGAPLLDILVGSQALNAVLLLGILPFMVALGRDPAVLGRHALSRAGLCAAGACLLLVAAAVVALGVLALVP